MSITQPAASFTRARAASISASTSPTRPATSSSSGVPRLAPHQICQSSSPSRSSVAVEHHHDVVLALLERLAQPAAGGDVQRLTDLVQHDPVPGGEQLEALMPGITSYSIGTRPRARTLDDPDRRVVERRVAPDQERRVAVAVEQHLLVRRHPGLVPVARRPVGSRAGHRGRARGRGRRPAATSPCSRQISPARLEQPVAARTCAAATT